jgi:2-keto-4-pentenoate hydratase/2-oxohepta-3-ene-1,7-dioic acid hydratase in catechol pathway
LTALQRARIDLKLPGNFLQLLQMGGDFSFDAGADEYRAWRIPLHQITRLAPAVPWGEKILCVGQNYRAHLEEMKGTSSEVPVIFSKFENARAAHGQAITLPVNAHTYDYEAELGVVIGKTAHRVRPERALDYVLGYCNLNDLSCREWQKRTSQWLLGKSLDGFLPTGPYLVLKSAIPDPQALSLRCWVNGELRQEGHTGQMIFSVAQIISFLSEHFPLRPGDLIATGTPAGVAMGMAEPRWLKAGDTVEVEVEGLGRLQNGLVAG